MERLTVKDAKEALSKMPDDAWIRCMDGGFLEVPVHLAATDVRLEERTADTTQPIVRVHWQ